MFARSLVARAREHAAISRSSRQAASEAEADALLARGEVQFVVSIPEDFARELLRGERPAVLVEADATDPAATGNALAALATLNRTALAHDLKGPLAALAAGAARRSSCACTAATTPKASRNTTSCPA